MSATWLADTISKIKKETCTRRSTPAHRYHVSEMISQTWSRRHDLADMISQTWIVCVLPALPLENSVNHVICLKWLGSVIWNWGQIIKDEQSEPKSESMQLANHIQVPHSSCENLIYFSRPWKVGNLCPVLKRLGNPSKWWKKWLTKSVGLRLLSMNSLYGDLGKRWGQRCVVVIEVPLYSWFLGEKY
jgi:hypothetical protein